MTSIQKSPSTPNDAKMSRREFVRRASAAGIVSAAMVSGGATAVPMIQTPRKGGILRVGSAGGNTTDGLDRRTWIDSVTLVCGFTACNMLVENSQDNAPIPERAESWEAKPDAAEWVFNLRQGVPFSNKLVGTGVMTIERFDPGVSVSFKRQRDYWKPDRG